MEYITDESQHFSIMLKEPPIPEGEASLVSINAPAEAEVDNLINISATIMNIGGDDSILAYLTDIDTNQIIGSRQEVFIPSGQENTFTWNITMPNRQLNLEVSSGHVEEEEQPPSDKLAGLAIHPAGHQQEYTPDYWANGTQWISNKVPSSSPVVVWVLGVAWEGDICHLSFPNPGGSYSYIEFSSTDEGENYLNAFDSIGAKVWLNIEPQKANVSDLINLVLNQYKHHPSIHGVAVDTEWLGGSDNPGGRQVTESECNTWLNLVKSYNTNYKLMFWHWEKEKMPPIHPIDVVFAYDPQGFSDYDQMKYYYQDWGSYFSSGEVSYIIGFDSDKGVWEQLPDPASEIANFLFDNVPNCKEVYWASWSFPEIYK